MKQNNGNWSIKNERTPSTGSRLPKHRLAVIRGMTVEQAAARTGLSLRNARRLLASLA